MPISRETLQKLAQFDTPTICNVIELFEIRPRCNGFMDGRVRACFPELPPMVGFACTAAFRAGAPPQSGDVYGSFLEQVEQFQNLPGPAVMVFQDLDDPPVGATPAAWRMPSVTIPTFSTPAPLAASMTSTISP